jgi:hypothetical protein
LEGKDQGLLDLISDLSYIAFKNKAFDAIIKNDFRVSFHDFDDLKQSKKIRLEMIILMV